MSWYRDAFGRHYRHLYRHRDGAEAARCVQTLADLAPFGRGPVLDLACGEGRHIGFIGERGVEVVGIDLSPEMLFAAARLPEEHGPFGLIRADMRRLPLATAAVSSVFSLFTSFGYFGGLQAHAVVIDEIRRVLDRGGHWFFDYLNCDKVRRELQQSGARDSRRQVEPFDILESRRFASDPDRVVKAVTIRPLPGQQDAAARWQVPAEGLQYHEEVALFSLADIDDMLERAGMVRVAAAGDYAGGPLSPERSPRWLLVYRKLP